MQLNKYGNLHFVKARKKFVFQKLIYTKPKTQIIRNVEQTNQENMK